MKYTVIWRNRLLSHLAAIYIRVREAGGNTLAITQAVAEIDALLRHTPLTRGESRNPGERILIVEPLSVYFEVHEEEKVVFVMSAVHHKDRNGDANGVGPQ